MAFTPRVVTDRVVQFATRYQLVLVSTGVYDLVPVPGTITAAGTIINKAHLQPIEDGLSGVITEEIMLKRRIRMGGMF